MAALAVVGKARRTYVSCDPRRTVLHRVVSEALPALRADLERRDERALPGFVERELDRFLRCGVLSEGFARFRYEACGAERLVPLSCKGRGFCQSCLGRCMVERAAHLVDRVLPHVPVRHWVLSLPFDLRYRGHGTTTSAGPCSASSPARCTRSCATVCGSIPGLGARRARSRWCNASARA